MIRLISPVGNADTLAPDGFWLGALEYGPAIPPLWRSVNDYGHYYYLTATTQPDGTVVYSNPAYHTGADLNLTLPNNFDADKHASVVALADGVVTSAAHYPEPSTWGNLVVIRSVLADGTQFWTRYAHMDTIYVTAGQTLIQGTPLGIVGNSFGRFPFHHHLDISTSGKLETKPGDWPGLDLTRLHTDYVDPLKFLRTNVNNVTGVTPVPPIPPPAFIPFQVTVATAVLNVRTGPGTSYAVRRTIKLGDVVTVIGQQDLWYQIAAQEYIASWLTTPVVVPAPPVPVVTDTIIDLFHGNIISNPAALKTAVAAKAITAILHKATEGTTFVDPAYTARSNEYGQLVTFGATHMLSADDPIAQAEFFLKTVNPQGTTPLAVDVEANGTPAQALVFAAHVKARTGKECMIYTRAGYWGDASAGNGPLWISSQQTPPVLPSKYATWALQQHTQSTIPGIDGLVDRDQFNGDALALTSFWPTVSGILIPEPTSVTMYVTEDGLRVRSGTATTYPILYYLNTDAAVTVETTLYDGSNLKWRKVVGKAEYMADMYLTTTKPPIVKPIPHVGSVLGRPKHSAMGAHTESKAYMWFLGWIANLQAHGRPLEVVTVITNIGDGKDEVTCEQVKAASPGTPLILHRIYYDNPPAPYPADWNKPDLTADGAAFMTAYLNWNPSHAASHLLILNEQPYGIGTPSWCIGAMGVAEAHGFKLALPAFSTGNPPNSWWQLPQTATMLRRMIAVGHILALHEYASPEGSGAWNVGMMAQTEIIHDLIPADCRSVIVVLSEYGMGTASGNEAYFLKGVRDGDKFIKAGRMNVRAALWCAGDWQGQKSGPDSVNSNFYPWRDALTAYLLE